QRRWQDGKTLTKTPLGTQIEGEFGAPHYIFHRGDLHGILAKAVPSEHVFLSHRCAGLEQVGDRVRVDFANGASADFDAVIAADRINPSGGRGRPGPEERRFACRAYRGLIPAEKVSDLPRESTAWLGPGRHFIHYFVSAGKYLNFVGHVEQDGWRSESWT